VNFASVDAGQGVQIVFDSNTGDSDALDITFEYDVLVGTLGATSGSAFAIGPTGSGNQDHVGGFLNAGGQVFDDTTTGTSEIAVASLNYDATDGSWDPTPRPGAGSSFADHDSTIIFRYIYIRNCF